MVVYLQTGQHLLKVFQGSVAKCSVLLLFDDGDDVADVANELLAARAVVFAAFAVDRVRAFGEGLQVGIPHVIARDIDGE